MYGHAKQVGKLLDQRLERPKPTLIYKYSRQAVFALCTQIYILLKQSNWWQRSKCCTIIWKATFQWMIYPQREFNKSIILGNIVGLFEHVMYVKLPSLVTHALSRAHFKFWVKLSVFVVVPPNWPNAELLLSSDLFITSNEYI